MEKRNLNVIFTKGGSGSVTTKLSVPKKWIDEMGISEDMREVVAEFDGKEIRLRRMSDMERLIQRIDDAIDKKTLASGKMGTESVTVNLELTEKEKEIFLEMEAYDNPHYWWEFEGDILTIRYTEDV